MKNKKVIRAKVRNWLDNNNYGDLDLGFSKDFEYRESDGDYKDMVCIGTRTGDCTEFLNCARRLGFDYTTNLIVLQFLHELGHYETHGDFSEKEIEEDLATRKVLYEKIEKGDELESETALILYYQILDQEIEATRWAVEFIKRNPAATRELQMAFKA